VVKTQFILYFYNPVAGQASTVGQEVMSLDAIVIKHLPKPKYVGRYRVSLDLEGLTKIGAYPLTAAQAHASTAWLRNEWVRGDPCYFRFYDMTGAIRQVRGVFQGDHADVFPVQKGNTKVFPKRADFAILSIDEEEAT
jgi:hypothetical protein